jgi:anti-sigma regulatory factor (Ser/Thr protein kinase)
VRPRQRRFHHEALLHTGMASLVAAAAPPMRAAVARGEPVLVLVDTATSELLRGSLGTFADGVRFGDMRALGRNPARLIPAWREFVDEFATAGRPVLGLNESLWPGRDAAAIVECLHHEALLAAAFTDDPAFRLLCAYDASRLGPTTLAAAMAIHPFVSRVDGVEGPDAGPRAGVAAIGPAAPDDLLAESLPDRPAGAQEYLFDERGLSDVRQFVEAFATDAGLNGDARRDLVLAANELATNSVRHAGGTGTARVWVDGEGVVCEVADGGRITDPLVGRRRPGQTAPGGRGLWMVNQLCDLVQIRSSPAGTVVRVHKGRTDLGQQRGHRARAAG